MRTDEHVALGQQAVERGDLAAAVAEGERALALVGGDAAAWSLLVRAHRRLGQPLDALKCGLQARRAGVDSAEFWEEMGWVWWHVGALEEVALAVMRLRERGLVPDQLAMVHAFATGDHAGAALLGGALAGEGANDRDFLSLYAAVLLQHGDHARAATVARQLLGLDLGAERWVAWNTLGAALAGQGDHAGAVTAAEQAIAAAPAPAEQLWTALALYQLNLGHREAGLAALHRGLDQHPRSAQLWSLLAQVSARGGSRNGAALATIARALGASAPALEELQREHVAAWPGDAVRLESLRLRARDALGGDGFAAIAAEALSY